METSPSHLAPPKCEHCGETRPVMVAMAPGRDGLPWWLCSRDWLDGVRSIHDVGAAPKPKKAIVVTPEVGDALKKSGWKVTDAAPGVTPTKRRARG